MILLVNFNEVRNYIIENIAVFGDISFTATDKTTNRQYQSIYLVEKPQNHIITSGNALIIKFHELNGGQVVRQHQVEIWILSNDLSNMVTIKDKIVNLLDFYNRPCEITQFNKFRFSNEGGIYFDDSLALYKNKLFFECKQLYNKDGE